jgi:ribosome-associated toxin RatA of RatAB toxin-antitoxin module
MEITRTALVLYPATDMFRLVRDVPSYPRFLSWCVNAVVHEETAETQQASLTVKVSGVTHTFTTRNRLEPGARLTMALVEGPFRTLSGEWLFQPLGEDGSKITLALSFDFSGKVLSTAFRRGFTHIADRLVSDFCRRADDVYQR